MAAVLAMESIAALWLVVTLGGLLSLGMMSVLIWQTRGNATRGEVHAEIGRIEKRLETEFREVDDRFESERKTAREANEKIYNRLNDCAKGVTKIEESQRAQQEMLSRLLDKHLEG